MWVHIGSVDRNFEGTLIFQNYKKLYAKNIEDELSSYGYQEEVLDELKRLEAKVLVPKETGRFFCAHLFCSKAETNDAIYRIGRILLDEDEIFIEEYRGARTPPYSALYEVFLEYLIEYGFRPVERVCRVSYSDLGKLVECINHLNRDMEEDKLKLVPTSQIHSLSIKQKKYYYNIVYWRKVMKKAELSDIRKKNIFEEIYNMIVCGDIDDFCAVQEKIEAFFESVDVLKNIYLSRKKWSEDIKKVGVKYSQDVERIDT